VVAERSVIQHGGEALERASAPQLVHAALDRRRGKRNAPCDVVVGAPAVLDEKRKNLTICDIHYSIC
jgi:hypothetical protein